jgi:hypothetical protein
MASGRRVDAPFVNALGEGPLPGNCRWEAHGKHREARRTASARQVPVCPRRSGGLPWAWRHRANQVRKAGTPNKVNKKYLALMSPRSNSAIRTASTRISSYKGMLRSLSSKRAWIVAILVLAFAVWCLHGSSEFKSCIQDYENRATYNNVHEGFFGLFVVFPMYSDCIGVFIDANGQDIIAVFTAVLAISTIFL